MKTDDRRAEGGGGQDQRQANVVRLPRDWLGPREELVPIRAAAGGPRTADEAEAGAPDAWPPTAHDFWGEDAAALHDAIRAPSEAEQPPPQTAEHGRTAPRPRPRGLRWPLLAIVSAAAVILVVSLIGASEGPSTRPRPTTATAHTSKLAASTPLAGSEPFRSSAAALHLVAVQVARAIHRSAGVTARHGRPHRASAHPRRRVSPPTARPRISPIPPTEPVDQGAPPSHTAEAAGAPQSSGTSEGQPAGPSSGATAGSPSAAAGGGTSQLAGPSGRVSLIGSGTSPSG